MLKLLAAWLAAVKGERQRAGNTAELPQLNHVAVFRWGYLNSSFSHPVLTDPTLHLPCPRNAMLQRFVKPFWRLQYSKIRIITKWEVVSRECNTDSSQGHCVLTQVESQWFHIGQHKLFLPKHWIWSKNSAYVSPSKLAIITKILLKTIPEYQYNSGISWTQQNGLIYHMDMQNLYPKTVEMVDWRNKGKREAYAKKYFRPSKVY